MGTLASCLAALPATTAHGEPPHGREDMRDARPWSRHTLVPSFGFGLGFSPDLVQVGLGLGVSYFAWHGLSFGLGVNDTLLIYGGAFRDRYPGVERQIPTNVLTITPSVQYVFYRSYRFSPYMGLGLGPVFFNHGNGIFGQWSAGPGAYIGIDGPVFLDVGVGFSGMFPTERCNDAFIYDNGMVRGRVFEGFCNFSWGPRLGLVLAFGATG